MIEPRKITLSSMDVSAEKRERLKELFPEVFSEDNIDYDQLKRVLGEWVEPQNERFGLNWLGKAECMKIIQEPSLATLKPVRDESVNFDETENLFIEGDNLEVLKLLQKSYFGKVKIIYIDPPYNTGKEFIYPDRYAMALDTYLAYTGQIDEYKRKFSTNTDTVGRYHSNWLNMMYPRLYLAKNLLRNDGVIFISIDDNEFAHLRELCDMIFGAENFVATINREAIKGGSQSTFLRVCHDYVLIYAKNISELSFSGYEKNPISLDLKDEKGAYAKGRELNKWGAGSRREDSPSMWFPIPGPNGEEVFPIRNDGSEGRWRLGKQKLLALVDSGDIIFEKRDDGTYIAYEMIRSAEPKIKQFTTIFKDKYINAKGTERIKSIFDMQRSYFDYAKPSELIFDFLVMADVKDGDLILDFFAGSSTTADAVMQFNATRDQQVNFLMVQLPEPTEESSIAYQNGYKTISDIAKERIRRAANTIATRGREHYDQTDVKNCDKLDLGFKVFKLSQSNFKIWEGNTNKIIHLEQQLFDHIDHINIASAPEDILYELLLKAGFTLTTQVKKLSISGKDVFSIESNMMLVCLDKSLNQAVINAMAEANPLQVICLDEGFKGNDQLKANAVQVFKSRSQGKESEIVFNTI